MYQELYTLLYDLACIMSVYVSVVDPGTRWWSARNSGTCKCEVKVSKVGTWYM